MLYTIQSGISELLCYELDDRTFWVMVDVNGHWTVLPVPSRAPQAMFKLGNVTQWSDTEEPITDA